MGSCLIQSNRLVSQLFIIAHCHSIAYLLLLKFVFMLSLLKIIVKFVFMLSLLKVIVKFVSGPDSDL